MDGFKSSTATAALHSTESVKFEAIYRVIATMQLTQKLHCNIDTGYPVAKFIC